MNYLLNLLLLILFFWFAGCTICFINLIDVFISFKTIYLMTSCLCRSRPRWQSSSARLLVELFSAICLLIEIVFSSLQFIFSSSLSSSRLCRSSRDWDEGLRRSIKHPLHAFSLSRLRSRSGAPFSPCFSPTSPRSSPPSTKSLAPATSQRCTR